MDNSAGGNGGPRKRRGGRTPLPRTPEEAKKARNAAQKARDKNDALLRKASMGNNNYLFILGETGGTFRLKARATNEFLQLFTRHDAVINPGGVAAANPPNAAAGGDDDEPMPELSDLFQLG
jgi:hypothetical protein